MSDTTTTETAIPALEPVQVTFEVPGRLHRDYSLLAEAGLYMSVEEALRHALITSWRYDRGSYHSLRLDVGQDDEETAETAETAGTDDQEPAPGA